MSVRRRLFLILLPALLGLAVFAGREVLRKVEEARALVAARTEDEFLGIVSGLAHELQVERGLSAGFLASKGQRSGPELVAQRKRVDEALARLVAAGAAAGPVLRGVAGPLAEARGAVAAQLALRARIDALGVTGPESFAAYTGTIERLLAVIGVAARDAALPILSRRLIASLAYTWAKEYAGRERATLNAAFTAKAFDPAVHRRAITVVEGQDVHLADFARYATEEERAVAAALVTGDAVAEAQALRTRALSVKVGDPLDVEPTRWFRAITQKIEHMRAVEVALADGRAKVLGAAAAEARRGALLAFALSLAATVLALVVGGRQSRAILETLGGEPDAAVDAARRIAAGDLTVVVPVRAGDATSVLAAMRRMQATLVEAVQSIREAADAVGCASSEIAVGSTDLAQRTEEQAASLEHTTASLDALDALVHGNAEDAARARALSTEASREALEGGELVGRVVGTMQEIRASSRAVDAVVEVLDGLAFQTKLLALNATVEAARAGDHGRGFAVVAQEVRSLAEQTAASARDIGALVRAAGEAVEHGVEEASHAGARLGAIVKGAESVARTVAHIAEASATQATDLGRIHTALREMNAVTEQNAALVEQSAASAESMRDQTQVLADAVSAFRLPARAAAPLSPLA